MGSAQSNAVATSIIQACRNGNLDDLQETLENNPKKFWKEYVKSGLRIASKRGHVHIVKELLMRKIKANKKDMFGWGAIEYACMGGYVEIVHLLTEQSDWKGSRTLLNDTPLHIACRFKRVDVVQLLLEKKAKVNAKNSNLDTPLIIASARGSLEIVQLLLDKDAKVESTNMQGKRAITVAKDKNIVALLMKAAGLTVGASSTSSGESKDEGFVEDEPESHPDFGTLLASYARYKTMKVKAVKCILSGPPKVGKTIFLNRILGRMENIQSSPHTPQSTGFEKPLTIPIYKSPEIVPTTITPEWIERTMEEEAAHLLKYLKASFDEEDGYVEGTATDDRPSFPERSALDKSSDNVLEPLSMNIPLTHQLDFINNPVERFFEDLLELDNPEVGDVLENITTVYLMDTGGQPEFHEILPVILHGPSLHLLFFNLSHNLEDEVEIDYREEKGKTTQITYKSNYNTLQMLYQLISSLYSISKESCNLKDAGLSATVLLATHVDLLKEESRKQDIIKKNDDLAKEFKQSDWYDDFLTFSKNDDTNVIFHPVDNMYGTQEEMANIRTFLTDLIDTRFTSRELPCIWVAFHMILRRRYEKPTGVCTLHQCTELAKECGIEELHVSEVLEYFHHNLGTVLYYKDVPKLNEIVICDPNILFQSITYLITASFGGEKLHHDSAEKVRKTGEIPTHLINFAISSSKDSPLTAEHLLNLLTHYNVITKMSYGENEAAKYFMPCLLLPDPQFNITTVTPDQFKSQPLLIKFEGGYIPVGVFSALIVRLSHIWRLDEANRFRNHVHFLDVVGRAKIELLCRLSCLEIYVEEGLLYLPVIRETVLESLQVVLRSCNHTKLIKHITGFYCPGSSPDNPHFSECTSPAAMLCSQRCPDYKNSVTPGPSIVKWFKEVLTNQDSTSSLQQSLHLPSAKLANSQKLFVWLSEKILINWKWVGRDLGIDDNELDVIKRENPSQAREQAYRMLLLWERETENPTYDFLWGSIKRNTTGIDQSDFVAKVNELEMSQADNELSTGYQEYGEVNELEMSQADNELSTGYQADLYQTTCIKDESTDVTDIQKMSYDGICVGHEKFIIQGDSPQFLNWEKYGLRITVPQDALSPTESSEITITALVGGCYDLPEGTELISAVYIIAVSMPLQQPVKLEIQHCVHLVTEDHTKCLSFATAPIPQSQHAYKFQLQDEGLFYPGNQYGSIWLSKFSVWTILERICQYFWPSSIYVGRVFYEEQSRDEWLMRFIVSRHLNALDEYIRGSLPQAKEGESVAFEFENEEDQIELIIGDHPHNGWSILPHKRPVQISKCIIDEFGAQNPSIPSVLITISAESTAVTKLDYTVPLMGVKSETKEIHIIRSFRPQGDPVENVQSSRGTVPWPAETFRKQIAYLATAIQPNFVRILDKLQSHCILSDTFIDDVLSIQGDSAYHKASKVVRELYRQITSYKDSCQHLNNICDVLLTEEDQILRSIAKDLYVI